MILVLSPSVSARRPRRRSGRREAPGPLTSRSGVVVPVRAGEGRRHRRGGSGRPTRRAGGGDRASMAPSARRGRSNPCEQVPPRVFGRLPRRGGRSELRRARPRKRTSGMGVGDVGVAAAGVCVAAVGAGSTGSTVLAIPPRARSARNPPPIRQGEPLRLMAPSSPAYRDTSRRCRSRGRNRRHPGGGSRPSMSPEGASHQARWAGSGSGPTNSTGIGPERCSAIASRRRLATGF
jgi:hypothetical protein